TRLTSLQTLNLGSNQLTTLPEAITRLASLQSLDLGSNQLTTLPEAITRLASLQSLDLSDNPLTTLPEAIARLASLQTLHLSGNQLTTLPKAISGLNVNYRPTAPAKYSPLEARDVRQEAVSEVGRDAIECGVSHPVSITGTSPFVLRALA